MLAISDAVLSAWLSPARQLRGRIKVKDTMYESEEFTSLSFDSGSISGETYQIGSTYMNTVKIVFPSILEEIAEDVEVVPEVAILVEDEYHYTKLGHFYVTEFDRDRNANTTTITASDKMIYMEGTYTSKLTFPKSYREVALEIANLAGVEVDENSFATLQNLSIAKPEGYTYRQAIGLIAQFEGGFASFNREGKLEIRRLRNTEFGITPESYLLKGFKKNENAYRIGGITVRIGDEESATLHVGATNGSQVMLENKVMTQSLLDLMWLQVKDLTYFPFELKWRGCPALEAGDWMYVIDRDGTRYSVPNLSYSLSFNGGMSAESKATTDSSSQATYKYRGPLSQKVDYLDNLLSSNGWNQNYYDTTEPENPKEGDAWFKKNGQDTELWIYEKDSDGNLEWVFKMSTATDPELIQAIDDVGKEVEQAQSDSATALENANNAVNKANEASAKADQSQQTADQAKSDATNASGKAQSALDSAGQAVSSATDALNQAALAKSQAEEAINKYLGMGMVPAWSWSPDGTDRFTTVYPNENLFLDYDGREQSILNNTAGELFIYPTNTNQPKTVTLKPSTKYTITVYARVDKNTARTMDIFMVNSGSGTAHISKTNIPLGTTLYKQTFTFTTNSSDKQQYYGRFDINQLSPADSVTMYCSQMKLEEGGQSTPFVPSSEYDYSNAVPSYIGFAIESSDNPADYTWIRNPEKVEGEVKVELTEINGELSRKVSQETFDQLNGTVINHSSLISQNQNEIKQKASQESVNTLTGRVTSAEGSISTIAGQVALKANQTEVDTIAGKVTSAESQLTVQAGKITALNTLTDGHTSQIGSLQSGYDGLSSTVSKVQTDLNGKATIDQFTNLSQTIDTIQSTVADKANQSQVTQLANQYTSVIAGLEPNLVPNSDFQNAGQGWGNTGAVASFYAINDTERQNGLPAAAVNKFRVKGTDVQTLGADVFVSRNLDVSDMRKIAGRKLRFSFYYTYSRTNAVQIYSRLTKSDGTNQYLSLVNLPSSGGAWIRFDTVLDLTGYAATDISAINITFKILKDQIAGYTFYAACPMVTATETLLDWGREYAKGTSQSQFTQMIDLINLRVTKDDLINQINISPEGILIDANRIQITGDTYIEAGTIKTAYIADAAITNAKIGSLSADKVTVGTLNGANVNIINLNASNIVSGEISGINIRAATFYGTSAEGTMQLNGTDLRFDTANNSFRLNYTGIKNSNTKYGNRTIGFYDEGIYIRADANNSSFGSPNYLNAGLELYGSMSYIDFHNAPNDTSDYKARIIYNMTGQENNLLVKSNSGLVLESGAAGLNLGSNVIARTNGTVQAKSTDQQTWRSFEGASFSQKSAHSMKQDFECMSSREALQAILETDIVRYRLKDEVIRNVAENYVGFVINDDGLSPYRTSNLLINRDNSSFNTTTVVGVLMAAVQELNIKIQKLEAV